MQPNGYSPANQYFPNEFQQPVAHLPSQGGVGYGPPRVFDPMGGMTQRISLSGAQPQGMFTRNLIGSLAASAFRLTDPSDRIGIWFILQDLSVRTEGLFRYVVNTRVQYAQFRSSKLTNPPQASILVCQRRTALHGTQRTVSQLQLHRQHRESTSPRLVLQRRLPSVLGQEVPRRLRKHRAEQVLRDARHQDPDQKRRRQCQGRKCGR